MVLDSGERVPGLGTFVGNLCRRSPGLTIVVTTRTPLGVEGEHRFHLPPLEVSADRTVPAVADNPSVRLFVALAVLAFYQGDLVDAEHHARLSLAAHRAAGTRGEDLASTLIALGNIARERGDYTRAAELYNESLSIRVRLDDTAGVARCLYGLANVSRERGDLDGAVDFGRRSLALREELGDRHGQALTRVALASTYRARGELDEAADHAAPALGRALTSIEQNDEGHGA